MAVRDWADYLYPNSFVLVNKLGLTGENQLRVAERALSADRQRAILSGQVWIPKTYDAGHLRAIHRELFKDVYDWAGEFRTVDISKNGFDFVPVPLLGRYFQGVRDGIASTQWDRLNRDQFVDAAARVLGK